MDDKERAKEIFWAGVEAVQPNQLLRHHIAISEGILTICGHTYSLSEVRHIYVVGAGKASAAMANAIENILGSYISTGLVTTKYQHTLPLNTIKIRESAHPVPDENCVEAVQETLQLLRKAGEGDVVICLISGGASALWCDVPDNLSLQTIQATFDLLIKSGASIHEINTVRKHLSQVKGGQLIRYCGGAHIYALIISDVPGDDPGIIASGPTVADASTFTDAYYILGKYNLITRIPDDIRLYIENGMQGILSETPKPGDSVFDKTINRIIGNNQIALQAAAQKANDLGYITYILPELVTGEAVEEAKKLVQMASGYTGEKPVCFLQGGETTVHVTGKGKGGRNQHFVLTAIKELQQSRNKHLVENIVLLSGGTDGTDGPTEAAGGIIDAKTLIRVKQQHLSVDTYLNNHDSWDFLKQTDSLLITGPTQTNVMDLMMVLLK